MIGLGRTAGTEGFGRIARAAVRSVLAGILSGLAACSSGPTDFADLSLLSWSTPSQEVRSEAEKAKLERELTATGDRVQSAGNAAEQGAPSVLALTVIRQQQAEEARALLEEAGVPCEDGKANSPECPPR